MGFMNIKRIGKIVGITTLAVIIIAFVTAGFIFYDVISYTATGSETLNPNGTSVGKAMVVYDPGLSGASETAARAIANQLQINGYTVELAGISSSEATKTSDYGIIVVGGPIYAGNASSSVKEYLKALQPSPGTRLGVFSTGSDPDTAKDNALLVKEAAPLSENNTLQINAGIKIVSAQGIDKQKINDFVDQLLGR